MWIRNDDRFVHHDKFARAAELLGGPYAFGRVMAVWAAGQCYANHNETDGVLTARVVRGFAQFDPEPEVVAAALVACHVREGGHGLWEARDGGYVIHDYEQYLPPADQQARVREARAEAGRKGGQRSGAARRAKARSKPEANPEATQKQTEANTPELTDATTADAAMPREANRSTLKPVPGTRYVPASLENSEAGVPPAREGPPPRRGALIGGPDPRIRRYGRVPVWQQQHDDLRARLGLADVGEADRRLDAFYARVEARWDDTGEIPLGRPFEVWQREFDRGFARPVTRAPSWASPPRATSPRWEAVCDALEGAGAINRHDRHTWFTPCRVAEDTSQVLRVRTNAGAVQWIRKHYGAALDQVLAAIAPDCRVELEADVEVDEAPRAAAAGGAR